jgi:hypothetical protein
VNFCFGEIKKKILTHSDLCGCTTVSRTQTEVLPTCEPGIPGRVQEVGVATETDFFGPDRKSRPTKRTGRTGLHGPIFLVLCRVYGKLLYFESQPDCLPYHSP